MPNHYTTRLVFDKPMSAALEKFLEGLSKVEGGLCQSLMPMPEIVRNTGNGFNKFKGPDGVEVEARTWYSNPHTNEQRLFTPEEAAELKKLGVSSWYDWAAKFWGTKWGTYDSEVEGPKAWTCISAWGPPHEKIFQTLADKFGVGFTAHGQDECEDAMQLVGRYAPSRPKKRQTRAKPAAKKRTVCPKTASKKKK